MGAPIDLVGRVTTVLRAVSSTEPDGATTSQVAQSTGLARATAHRLLTSLQAQGFADRTAEGRWLLGPELYLMGQTASARYDVTSLAQPIVRRLSQITGESAFFSARRGWESVCLLREDGSFPVRSHVLYEGIRFPLGVASAGMAILAFLPQSEIDAYLSDVDLQESFGTEHGKSELSARLRQTRADGYALNPGLLVEGSWGLGAAVFDSSGSPRWALSLTGIEQRIAPRSAHLGALLLDHAHRLTTAISSAAHL